MFPSPEKVYLIVWADDIGAVDIQAFASARMRDEEFDKIRPQFRDSYWKEDLDVQGVWRM